MADNADSPGNRALIEAGRLLYGSRYQTALAHDLGVLPRSLGHWVKGRDPVPPARLNQIADLLDARADACRALSPGIRDTAAAIEQSRETNQRRKPDGK